MDGRSESPPRFLRHSFNRHSTCLIRRLPLTVLVDDILLRLSLTDVLILRKVDKAFYVLTHEVTIWKRFFCMLDLPVPLFHENASRFTIDPREYEYERHVARAIMLEDNWRASCTRAYNVHSFALNNYEMLEMKLMPGGKYLVASARYLAPRNALAVYFVMVLHVNGLLHPVNKILFQLKIQSRAYRLQARFMLCRGEPNLVVSFVTRTYKRRQVSSSVDLSSVDYDKHIAVPLDYMWQSGCIPTADLERSTQTEAILKTWYSPVVHGHNQRIDCSVLFMCNDQPMAAFVEQPHKFTIYNLDTTLSEGLPFHSPDPNCWVRAIRVLTSQNRILVIRTWQYGVMHNHYVEVYKYFNTSTPQSPLTRFKLNTNDPYVSFGISEPTQMTEFPPGLPFPKTKAVPSHYIHPPISIFAHCGSPRSLEHYQILPKESTSALPTYNVKPAQFEHTSRYIYDSLDFNLTLISAVHRPLIFTIRPDRNVIDIRRYYLKINTKAGPFDEREPLVPRVWYKLWQPTRMINSISLIPDNVLAQASEDASRSHCVAWDETSGHIYIATAPDASARIIMVDLSLDIQRNPLVDTWKNTRRTEVRFR